MLVIRPRGQFPPPEPFGIAPLQNKMKSVRFASVVEKAGKPALHLAWSAPVHDAALQKAAREMRLLTIHQELRGGKKDHGAVGLESGKNVQYFIFPRPLKRFTDARVVGIDYALVEGKMTASPAEKPDSKFAPAKAKPSRPETHGHESSEHLVEFPASVPISKKPAAPTLIAPKTSPRQKLASLAEIRREVAAALRELRAQRNAAAQHRLADLLASLPRSK